MADSDSQPARITRGNTVYTQRKPEPSYQPARQTLEQKGVIKVGEGARPQIYRAAGFPRLLQSHQKNRKRHDCLSFQRYQFRNRAGGSHKKFQAVCLF